MSRIFLQYVLPLVLPAVLYVIWIILHEKFSPKPTRPLREGPWFWIILVGFALMAASTVILALSGNNPIEGRYVAPYLENGKMIPGRVIEQQK